ncbi:PAS domain S-box-containing protein [Nonomuraea maritima]|uniref:protein-serine/threonine phosphatase n=1 Tax=Nonomuraea maritima TaxID=683260 RepID=A0A1G9H6W7_9ACTN|nr:SpoIIE family protein phosphatase [Nonomuraea maritima]SDL08690.1 PAS domain S-box-containing protein [Nonomuraea maritima]
MSAGSAAHRRAEARSLPAAAVIDADGVVLGWTRAAERLLGYRPADIVGHSAAILLTPGDHDERLSSWAREYGHRDSWSGLAEVRHRSGDRLVLHLQGHRLPAADGRSAWVLSANPASMKAALEPLVEPLVQRSPVAIWIWDRDLRCVWRNAKARHFHEVLSLCGDGEAPPEEPLLHRDSQVAKLVRQALEDGTPVIDNEVRLAAVDGSTRTLSISVFRLDDVDGLPIGVCSLAIDVTQSMARERVSLLVEASTSIGTSLDVWQTAQELAQFGVPDLADYVVVDLVESVLPESVLPDDDDPDRPSAETYSSVFRRAGMASSRPSGPPSPWARGEVVFLPPDSPYTDVLATGCSFFEPVVDTSPGTWMDHDPKRARVTREEGMHSRMVVPLRARGETLGVTAFIRSANPTPFTWDDLIIAEEFVARAALSLDSARRYTRERTAALALQHSLLPRRLSGGDVMEVAHRYLPSGTHSGVGGDWYDAIPLDDGRIAVVVGDVTGHGINAAALMGRVRTAVRTLAYLGMPPCELLARLDVLVAQLHEQDDEGDDSTLLSRSSTCMYAVYDPATRRLSMATAGHPPPVVVHPDGEAAFPELFVGPPVGLALGSYASVEVELPAGTVVALYTDGLIERRDDDLDAGMERLREALASRVGLPLEILCTSVINAMVGGRAAEDDVALLVIRTR